MLTDGGTVGAVAGGTAHVRSLLQFIPLATLFLGPNKTGLNTLVGRVQALNQMHGEVHMVSSSINLPQMSRSALLRRAELTAQIRYLHPGRKYEGLDLLLALFARFLWGAQ